MDGWTGLQQPSRSEKGKQLINNSTKIIIIILTVMIIRIGELVFLP